MTPEGKTFDQLERGAPDFRGGISRAIDDVLANGQLGASTGSSPGRHRFRKWVTAEVPPSIRKALRVIAHAGEP